MESGEVGLGLVISEHQHTRPFWGDGRVIGGWDKILTPIAGPDSEGKEWTGVQELANSRNHTQMRTVKRPQFKTTR